MYNCNPSSESGITILETLIAAVILVLLSVGVMSSFSTAFVADRSSTEVLSSRNFAEEVMESARDTAFSQLLTLNSSTVSRDGFTATTTVTQLAASLMRLEVRVTHSNNPQIGTQVVSLVADR